ncbi:ATP-dependent DNA ligase [Sphingobacterium spiritivorum]|uniref:ATP-dependent DNA ligase n=1 Tax=Sphingobacterium spiritivorum TaxID=258 RepID=UPI003DA1CF0E
MKDFVELFEALDSTTRTNEKIEAIHKYLINARQEDQLFGIALLMGNKPKRPVKTSLLKIWAAELADIPLWLLDESYYIVGDLAESLALVLPTSNTESLFELHTIYLQLINLYGQPEDVQKEVILGYWTQLSGTALFLFNKFLTGNFRVGVSKKIVGKALARYLEMEEPVVEHRLMGKWSPLTEQMDSLFFSDLNADKHFLPYPFYLAYAIDSPVEELGDLEDWILEPKLDGIRGQLIIRKDELFVWSRGEDLMTEKFPEFHKLKDLLPNGTVIDGEVIPWKEGVPLDFNVMQTRIGRKNLSAKTLADAPLVMVCYDLLEWEGKDLRTLPLEERRNLLQYVLDIAGVSDVLLLSPALQFRDWEEAASYRVHAREHNAEGLMIKRKSSPYETGRKRGNWWKWKTDPMTIDGVLIYAQSGHGRRANLFTDYTFAVWDGEQLVPFAKAYSGLTDKELISMDNWIKRNTIEKFGPVRSVKPEMVFELAFEGINLSSRHKSGVALRFPRILRWRKDKLAKDANTKQDLLDLIESLK